MIMVHIQTGPVPMVLLNSFIDADVVRCEN